MTLRFRLVPAVASFVVYAVVAESVGVVWQSCLTLLEEVELLAPEPRWQLSYPGGAQCSPVQLKIKPKTVTTSILVYSRLILVQVYCCGKVN